MSREESKQKTAALRHSVSSAVWQAIADTGGVTDCSLIALENQSPLEMRITLTIHKWRPAYSAFAEGRKRAGNKRQREKQIKAIREADRVLKFWIPWLCAEISGDLLCLVANGELGRVADWLSRWPPQSGRTDEFILAACAEDLAVVFKRSGRRKPPWTEIGEIIATKIPEAGAARSVSDRGQWIYQLVKRHRRRKEELKKIPEVLNPTFQQSELRPDGEKNPAKTGGSHA
jgi:hypothetical protein